MMSDYETSTLRQYKILVVVLILSNVVIGVSGFCFLRAVDRRYTSLIEQVVPSLNELQTLTACSVEAMRSTNPALFGESTQDRERMSQRARAALERDHDLRSRALKREWLASDVAERQNFQDAGEAFSRSAATVVNLLESGESAGAIRQREESLRPAFERYLAVATETADLLEAKSLRTTGTLTARTGDMSRVILGLGSWPVMLLCAFLLITAVFVAVVLLKVLFSGKEAL